jgi:hypothetical protein
MTLSTDARRANLNEALIAFLGKLGDEQFLWFRIEPGEYSDVWPTTWIELTGKRLIRDMNMTLEGYGFTVTGYVEALKLSGKSDEQTFREGLGSLCKALKGHVKDRTDDGLVAVHDLVKESGVSEAFVHNALDAELIDRILRKKGAHWHGEHFVRVPRDFGLTPI